LKTRFREHSYQGRNNKLRNFLYQHFRKSGHSFNNITVQPVEHLTYDDAATSSFKSKARFIAELNWIKNLQTPFPLGLNDNIYQCGNISKDPSIDIFSIFSIRKRKSRSHGIRKNGNIKRKSYKHISILDLHKLRLTSGKHTMLSRLSSLSISTLKDIDEQADKIFLRNDPLNGTASFIQSFTQHILRPHIDTVSDHKRSFLKIPFINKGIDFIDLQSIFRDKNIIDSIPKYFKNTEPPIICYKYKKPIRSIIFNYNNIVSDLNIDANVPDSCDCISSKFCYSPVGHVITGNFNIIQDKRIRNLLTKGPKFRLPASIDFNSCRVRIAEALQNFSINWCRKEHADLNALSDWKKRIFEIIDKRISFYNSNGHLLPPKPRTSYRHLKKDFQDLHSKYVFVPADKASNNVIII